MIGGKLVAGPEDADEGAGYVEPLPGLRIWVTPRLSMLRPKGFDDAGLLQVEFLWNDAVVEELDRAVWPPAVGEPGAAPDGEP